MVTFLLLYFLSTTTPTSFAIPQYQIHGEDVLEVRPIDPIFEQGQTLTITCRILHSPTSSSLESSKINSSPSTLNTFSSSLLQSSTPPSNIRTSNDKNFKNSFNSSHLGFKSRGSYYHGSPYVQIVNESTTKLTIPNVNSSHSGLYSCLIGREYKKNGLHSKQYVHIAKKPLPPTALHCHLSHLSRISCSWSPSFQKQSVHTFSPGTFWQQAKIILKGSSNIDSFSCTQSIRDYGTIKIVERFKESNCQINISSIYSPEDFLLIKKKHSIVYKILVEFNKTGVYSLPKELNKSGVESGKRFKGEVIRGRKINGKVKTSSNERTIFSRRYGKKSMVIGNKKVGKNNKLRYLNSESNLNTKSSFGLNKNYSDNLKLLSMKKCEFDCENQKDFRYINTNKLFNPNNPSTISYINKELCIVVTVNNVFNHPISESRCFNTSAIILPEKIRAVRLRIQKPLAYTSSPKSSSSSSLSSSLPLSPSSSSPSSPHSSPSSLSSDNSYVGPILQWSVPPSDVYSEVSFGYSISVQNSMTEERTSFSVKDKSFLQYAFLPNFNYSGVISSMPIKSHIDDKTGTDLKGDLSKNTQRGSNNLLKDQISNINNATKKLEFKKSSENNLITNGMVGGEESDRHTVFNFETPSTIPCLSPYFDVYSIFFDPINQQISLHWEAVDPSLYCGPGFHYELVIFASNFKKTLINKNNNKKSVNKNKIFNKEGKISHKDNNEGKNNLSDANEHHDKTPGKKNKQNIKVNQMPSLETNYYYNDFYYNFLFKNTNHTNDTNHSNTKEDRFMSHITVLKYIAVTKGRIGLSLSDLQKCKHKSCLFGIIGKNQNGYNPFDMSTINIKNPLSYEGKGNDEDGESGRFEDRRSENDAVYNYNKSRIENFNRNISNDDGLKNPDDDNQNDKKIEEENEGVIDFGVEWIAELGQVVMEKDSNHFIITASYSFKKNKKGNNPSNHSGTRKNKGRMDEPKLNVEFVLYCCSNLKYGFCESELKWKKLERKLSSNDLTSQTKNIENNNANTVDGNNGKINISENYKIKVRKRREVSKDFRYVWQGSNPLADEPGLRLGLAAYHAGVAEHPVWVKRVFNLSGEIKTPTNLNVKEITSDQRQKITYQSSKASNSPEINSNKSTNNRNNEKNNNVIKGNFNGNEQDTNKKGTSIEVCWWFKQDPCQQCSYVHSFVLFYCASADGLSCNDNKNPTSPTSTSPTTTSRTVTNKQHCAIVWDLENGFDYIIWMRSKTTSGVESRDSDKIIFTQHKEANMKTLYVMLGLLVFVILVVIIFSAVKLYRHVKVCKEKIMGIEIPQSKFTISYKNSLNPIYEYAQSNHYETSVMFVDKNNENVGLSDLKNVNGDLRDDYNNGSKSDSNRPLLNKNHKNNNKAVTSHNSNRISRIVDNEPGGDKNDNDLSYDKENVDGGRTVQCANNLSAYVRVLPDNKNKSSFCINNNKNKVNDDWDGNNNPINHIRDRFNVGNIKCGPDEGNANSFITNYMGISELMANNNKVMFPIGNDEEDEDDYDDGDDDDIDECLFSQPSLTRHSQFDGQACATNGNSSHFKMLNNSFFMSKDLNSDDKKNKNEKYAYKTRTEDAFDNSVYKNKYTCKKDNNDNTGITTKANDGGVNNKTTTASEMHYTFNTKTINSLNISGNDNRQINKIHNDITNKSDIDDIVYSSLNYKNTNIKKDNLLKMGNNINNNPISTLSNNISSYKSKPNHNLMCTSNDKTMYCSLANKGDVIFSNFNSQSKLYVGQSDLGQSLEVDSKNKCIMNSFVPSDDLLKNGEEMDCDEVNEWVDGKILMENIEEVNKGNNDKSELLEQQYTLPQQQKSQKLSQDISSYTKQLPHSHLQPPSLLEDQQSKNQPHPTFNQPHPTINQPHPSFKQQTSQQKMPIHTNTSPQHTNTSPQHTNTSPKHTNTSPQHTNILPQYTKTQPKNTKIPPQHTNIPSKHTNAPIQRTNTPPQHTNIPPHENIPSQNTNIPPHTNITQQQTNFPTHSNMTPQHTNSPQQLFQPTTSTHAQIVSPYVTLSSKNVIFPAINYNITHDDDYDDSDDSVNDSLIDYSHNYLPSLPNHI